MTPKPLVDPLCLCRRPHPCELHGGYETQAAPPVVTEPMITRAQRAQIAELVALVAAVVRESCDRSAAVTEVA